MKKLTCLVLILILAVPPKAAFSWSEGGHHIISLMAFDLLNKGEQAKLVAILEKHPRYAEDFSPPETLPNDEEVLRWRIGRAGYWPDIARKQPKYHRSTWHYELGPTLVIGDPTSMKIPERPGMLPSNATLETQSLHIAQALTLCGKTLADSKQPESDRAIALCWIAHLVADAHQPCHAGSLYMEKVFVEEDGDRGANRVLTKQRKNCMRCGMVCLVANSSQLTLGEGLSRSQATQTWLQLRKMRRTYWNQQYGLLRVVFMPENLSAPRLCWIASRHPLVLRRAIQSI